MTEEYAKVYSIFPCKGNGLNREKIIKLSEKEAHLNSKFWRDNEEKAKQNFDAYFSDLINKILDHPSMPIPQITNLCRIYSKLEVSNNYKITIIINVRVK